MMIYITIHHHNYCIMKRKFLRSIITYKLFLNPRLKPEILTLTYNIVIIFSTLNPLKKHKILLYLYSNFNNYNYIFYKKNKDI